MDFNIKLKNGQVLKRNNYKSGRKCTAIIIFVHGLGEHIQRYYHWADLLTGEGIGFTGVDLPVMGVLTECEVILKAIPRRMRCSISFWKMSEKHFPDYLFLFMDTVWEEELSLTIFCGRILK